MSNRSSLPATSRSKLHKAGGTEVDPRPPPQLLKPAVRDKVHKSAEPRSPGNSVSERRLSECRNTKFQHGQGVVKSKEHLASAENEKTMLLRELDHSKRLTEELSVKLNEAVETSKRDKLRVEELERNGFTAAEKLQSELEALKRQHEEDVNGLEASKQALVDLKQELVASLGAKDEAVRLAGEAMRAAEATSKRAEELSAELLVAKCALGDAGTKERLVQDLMMELSAAKEALAEAHAANEELTKEGAAILAAKDSDLKKVAEEFQQARTEIENLKGELLTARELELKLACTDSALQNLKHELVTAKDLESKASLAAADIRSNFEKTQIELEQAKMSESVALASLKSVSAELEEARGSLKNAAAEAANLAALVNSLELQLERNEKNLADVRERESRANAQVVVLTNNLDRIQNELAKALADELAAKESVQSLSVSLQKLSVNAEQAKIEVLAAQAEVQREKTEVTAAQAEVQAARNEAKIARELADKVKEEAETKELELQTAKKDAAEAIAGLQAARAEADKARAATQAANMEALIVREEVQIVQKKVQEAQAEARMGREQVSSAREEARAAISRVDELKSELKRAHLDAEEAAGTARDAESKLQDVLREMGMTRAISESSIQDKSIDKTETWDTAESKPFGFITISQEEYDSLKMQLEEVGSLLEVTKTEASATKVSKDELSRKLEAVTIEMEASKLEALLSQEQLEEAEKARSSLNAEVQRLRTNIDQDQNSVDLPMDLPNSGLNGCATSLVSQGKILQLDSSGQPVDTFGSHKDEDRRGVPALVPKNKKKAVLTKIGSYLSKIKSP